MAFFGYPALVSAPNALRQQSEACCGPVLTKGHAPVRVDQHPLDDSLGAIVPPAVAHIPLHARHGVLIKRQIGWQRIGLSVEQHFVRILGREVLIPLARIGQAVVFVEEINGVAQEITMRLQNMVAVLLVLLGCLLVGEVHLGNNVQVG